MKGGRLRLLLVDDDPSLRKLLSATLDGFDLELEEAASAEEADAAIERQLPDVVVLDIAMPGTDGLELCRRLKAGAADERVPVVLLTGSDAPAAAAEQCGADAYLRKPFRPLELLGVIERVAGVRYGLPLTPVCVPTSEEEQLVLYARDLRHLLELERGQRRLVQNAYRETIGALASALESKDTGTRAHSQRVQRYASELTAVVAPEPARRPEHGVRLPAARRREDRHPRRGAAEAAAADRRGGAPDADAHAARRADARRHRLPPG